MRRFISILVIGIAGFAVAHAPRAKAQSWSPTRTGSESPIRIEEYGSFSDRGDPLSYETRYQAARIESVDSGASRSRVDAAYNTGTGLPPVQLDPNCAYPTVMPPPVVYPPVAPLMQAAPPLVAYTSAPIFAGPGFYASADALFLDRYHSDFVATRFFVGAVPLRASDFNFDHELGPRVTIGYLLANGNAIEGTYFGTYHWNEAASRAGFGLLEAANWTSKLHSAELNFRLALTEIASGFVGFRYIRIEEDFTDQLFFGGALVNMATFGTINDLFGFHVGGDVDVLQLNRLSISINGAAGFFVNNQRNRFAPSVFAPGASGRVREQELASLVEAGARVRYRVVGNLYAHGGYDVMMVNGVALAAEQVPGLITSNSIFYHGPSMGVTWRR